MPNHILPHKVPFKYDAFEFIVNDHKPTMALFPILILTMFIEFIQFNISALDRAAKLYHLTTINNSDLSDGQLKIRWVKYIIVPIQDN